ncbi:MAG: formate dehydrogenase accessory sulfurtransferase FdhD [Desulfococcaceae bacterium]|nr:formate dehydrogenase accessory sulfurtransferase FdhD [Desulfococcaceae bacterium]
MQRTVPYEVIHWTPDRIRRKTLAMAGEAPLSVSIQGKPWSVEMRTPGEEKVLAAGSCLSQGIAESPEDIESIEYPVNSNPNLLNIRLMSKRWEKIADRISSPKKGIPEFGKNTEDAIEALCRIVRIIPVPEKKISVRKGFAYLAGLNRHQPLRSESSMTHATAVYSHDFELLTVKEDVGRHNGMDKAIGQLMADGNFHRAGVMVISSRVSFDLVQKSARAGIPVIFSVSRPTALAVKTADRLNMSISCESKNTGGYIYTAPERLDLEMLNDGSPSP